MGGTPGYNFNWSTGHTSAVINPSPIQTSSYTLTVSDANNCTMQATTQVIVNALPEVTFTSSEITQGCGPLCINFTNTSSDSQSQTWNFGNGATSTGTMPTYCYNQPGSYNVSLTVTGNNGCLNTLTKNNYVTVYPDPVAAFISTPQPATILDPVVYYIDQSQGAISWQWSFGDALNNFSQEQNPTYTYSDTGSYQVRLVVTNVYGCSDTTENSIKINPDYILYAPNAFTPNGDGKNEIFIPMGVGFDADEYELMIFDRWGNMIFKSIDPFTGWNGKANNGSTVAQQDTYVWKVIVRDVLGKRHRYTGSVNLIK